MHIEAFSAPMIAMAVYVCIELFKEFVGHKEQYKRWYPIIAGVLGMVFATVAYITGVVEIPAKDLVSAIFVGLCSGLCATGTDQLIHKIVGKKVGDTSGEQDTVSIEEAELPSPSASDEQGKEG